MTEWTANGETLNSGWYSICSVMTLKALKHFTRLTTVCVCITEFVFKFQIIPVETFVCKAWDFSIINLFKESGCMFKWWKTNVNGKWTALI